jgi:hypothetical protein
MKKFEFLKRLKIRFTGGVSKSQRLTNYVSIDPLVLRQLVEAFLVERGEMPQGMYAQTGITSNGGYYVKWEGKV